MTKKIKTIEYVWHASSTLDTAQNINMTIHSLRADRHTGDARFIAMEEWAYNESS